MNRHIRNLASIAGLLGLLLVAACSDDVESQKQDEAPEQQQAEASAPTVETEKTDSAEATKAAALERGLDSSAHGSFATLRKLGLSRDATPPRMMPEVDTDFRQVRNYPEQPPVIPHSVEGYQIDKNHNQCMDCHKRTSVGVSQAPMVSVSHFMDRDGQFLASISPRRYYCNQCHVSQLEVEPIVDNVFVDVETLISIGDWVEQKNPAAQ